MPLIASATPQQTGKSDCKWLITHSGFAEFVTPTEGGTHKLAIKVSPSVKWAIRNSTYVDWIHITDGDSGMGPGTMTVQLDANTGRYCRVGVLTISGLGPIYGSPIRILQRGTESSGAEEQAVSESSTPWLVNIAPFSSNDPQATGKPEPKKTYKRK